MGWEATAAQQGGVVDRTQLRGAGLTERQVDGRVVRGELAVVLPSVYRAASTPLTDAGRRWAGVLWSGGIASHATAGALWGLPVTPDALAHVSVPDLDFRRRAATWVRVHRVQLSLAECTRLDDLPVTDRRRTVVDLLGVLPLSDGRALLRWALRNGSVTLADLDRHLVVGRGRSGNVRIRTLRREADPRAQAEFERRVHALLRERGVAGLVPQFPVVLPSGAVIHADIVFPEHKLIVELDGWAWHNTGDRFAKDRRRWRGAVASGWRVVQFTWDDLDRPDAFIREISQLLAA